MRTARDAAYFSAIVTVIVLFGFGLMAGTGLLVQHIVQWPIAVQIPIAAVALFLLIFLLVLMTISLNHKFR